ncbi:MAG: DUF1801 domain-containing protein [Flavobacteriales bacterium]|jgi:hypothetical protein|nr:DUF1801 domain-containing protein [Flavobacteriales bacterium]MBK7941374.1 DUF1801 domain-containing protein [Flavobacteriales bacterium]MBK8949199.1 DUF1801 domain-containing protein [Flavobacteriales bacterium]MBK9701524.1 DUF1801 domain-containing protein [Flavobacteriales bacterium]
MATIQRKTTTKKAAARKAPTKVAAPKRTPTKKTATNKTQATTASAEAFVGAIADVGLRADCEALLRLMRKATGQDPVMWGPAMVGFGRYSYTYDSGRSGEWSAVGFSPRKANLTLYLMAGFDQHTALLGRLGKHTVAKSCLYLKRLADVDLAVLERLVAAAYIAVTQRK